MGSLHSIDAVWWRLRASERLELLLRALGLCQRDLVPPRHRASARAAGPITRDSSCCRGCCIRITFECLGPGCARHSRRLGLSAYLGRLQSERSW